MKIRIIIILLMAGLSFLLMVIVNETSGPSSIEYRKDKCTRYCHNNTCPHTLDKYRNHSTPFIISLEKIYYENIHWLKNNGIGLSYKEMNLLLYVGLAPLITGLLFWGAMRKQSYGKTDQ
jgi:hypothetical protein